MEAAGFLKNPPRLAPRPDFAKNLRPVQTYRHGPQATCVPPKGYPQMVWPGHEPGHVCIDQASYAFHPSCQSRQFPHVQHFCHQGSYQDDQQTI